MRASSSLLPLVLLVACSGQSADAPAVVAPKASEPEVVRVQYRGMIDLEAHLARPGDTVPLALDWEQTCAEDRCVVVRTTGVGEDASTVTMWSTPEAVWVEGAPQRLSEEEATNHRRLVALLSPTDEAERAIRFAHPRLGTLTDRAIYEGETVTVDFHDSDIAWTGALSVQPSVSPGILEVPTPPPPLELAAPSISALDEGLWDVRVPAVDARSLVVEFPSFLVVLEAPWSSAVGEMVVDLIAEQLPNKPIRYVLYSHHHPHYTGGLRAFMAAGASILVANSQVEFVRRIAGLDFSLQPDRFARGGGEASVIGFDETFTIAVAGRSLQVIDIGEQSNHTVVYDVFWLPESKTLIQGDIGWFVAPDGAVRVGGRSAGLLQAIDDRGLAVERLIQTWPVNSQEPALDMPAFRAAFEQ